uniref:AlNc14C10G1280 protein n=1 Tax=Albugo laibachii Nc14 TaxID=890382 RepID=F0W2P0_9STRA|nr:AlNc14C10G1280 [Albugo laibachii Nc14]|eukprot:CCA15326.1 AlNc14C10G1280 [Albugo laibachii Nc14]
MRFSLGNTIHTQSLKRVRGNRMREDSYCVEVYTLRHFRSILTGIIIVTITLAVYLLWSPLAEWNVDTNSLYHKINTVDSYISALHEKSVLVDERMRSFLQQCQMIRMTASTRNGVIAKHMVMAFEEAAIERVCAYGETFREYRENGWHSANDMVKNSELEAQIENDEPVISESVLLEIHTAVDSIQNAEISDGNALDPFNLESEFLRELDSNVEFDTIEMNASPSIQSEPDAETALTAQIAGYYTGLLPLCVVALVIYSGWNRIFDNGRSKSKKENESVLLRAINALDRVIVLQKLHPYRDERLLFPPVNQAEEDHGSIKLGTETEVFMRLSKRLFPQPHSTKFTMKLFIKRKLIETMQQLQSHQT